MDGASLREAGGAFFEELRDCGPSGTRGPSNRPLRKPLEVELHDEFALLLSLNRLRLERPIQIAALTVELLLASERSAISAQVGRAAASASDSDHGGALILRNHDRNLPQAISQN